MGNQSLYEWAHNNVKFQFNRRPPKKRKRLTHWTAEHDGTRKNKLLEQRAKSGGLSWEWIVKAIKRKRKAMSLSKRKKYARKMQMRKGS